MANKKRCGCGSRRENNNSYGCLSCLGGRYCWDNYPYYGGPCPDRDGCYDCDGTTVELRGEGNRCNRRNRGCYGIFSSMLPVAVAANGIIPLVSCGCGCDPENFCVNSGLITLREPGTYLATYTVRVPDAATVDSTFSLNVNGIPQAPAITQVGGTGPVAFTAQAMFDVGDRATVDLRTSDAINLTDPSTQPLATLSIVRLEEEQ